MCPAAVDWEAAWPTRRSLAYGADEDDEAKVSVFTQSPARSAASPGHERGGERSRNRSLSPGRGVIPPAITSEAKAGQAEHAIGALVSYWSGTHQQWMDAKVTRQSFDARGLLVAYDLDVKRGAQANKIRKRSPPSDLLALTEQQANQAPLPASMVQRVPTPVSNTATGLGEPAQPIGVHQVAQPIGDSGSPLPAVGPSTVALAATPDPIAATQAVAAAAIASKIAGLAHTPGGAGITPEPPHRAPSVAPTPASLVGPQAVAAEQQPSRADLQAPPSEAPDVSSLCSFNVGDKVEYWSGTYYQWMTAKVERVRTDTSLYDLDVKRGAQRKKMREHRGGPGPDAPNPATAPTQADRIVAPPSALMPVRPVLKSASPAQPVAAWAAAPNTGAGNVAGTTTSVSPSHPPQGTTTLRSTDREAVTSSRLRGLSRDTYNGDDDVNVTPAPKLANAPAKITVPGAYPRSGSPLLNGKPQERSGAPIGAGASQNAPAGDPSLNGPQLEGRNRTFAGGALAMGRGRHDLGRPGPISTSGSLGLATSLGEGIRPAIPGTLTPSGLLAGSKAPHRLLPDSSAGPTIGTRPDTTIATSSGSGASPAGSSAGGVRGGIVGNITGGIAQQARGLGHVTINGVAKKVDLNGFVSGGVGSGDKVMVQRDGDKVVVRQLPGTVPAASFTNGATPSTSSHRPPPSTTTVAASAAASAPAIRWASAAKKAPEESQTETARNGVQLEGLEASSPADLALLIRDLCADCLDEEDLALLDELEPEDTREQIVAALGRLSIQDLGKRLAEAHVDASVCKERKELESLLVLTILSRQRGNETPTRLHMSPPSLPATPERRVSPPVYVSNGARESCPSELVATGLSGSSLSETGLEVGELDIGSERFDPTQPELRAQLTAGLGFSPNSTIEEMTGFRGGLNEGVWFLSDQRQSPPVKDLVLKLVKCTRISSRILTEAENFVKINNDHPQIARDPGVAFPVRIFKCHGPAPERLHRYDLIVMWKVHGERLTEWIAHKWYSKAFEELWQIFDRLGHIIYAFHDRYCDSQHGDFQPSNVFFDEESGDISLIDIGGMGVPTSEGDVDHFSKSLKLLADAYGSQLLQGVGHFEAAHATARAR